MNETELLNGINQIISNHYNVIKDAYEEAKFELGTINQQLTLFNNFLKMIKKPSDFYKKNVLSFYDNKVSPVLETFIDDIANEIAEEDKENEANRLELISEDSDECINERLKCLRIVVNQLNNKKEIIGDINVYSEQTNRLKRLLKSLNSNMYYEDEVSFNNVTEYINESDILESTKNDLLNLIKNKRNNYLKEQEEIKKELEIRRKLLEQKRLEEKRLQEAKKIKKQDNRYKFSYEDFLDDENLELIKEINGEIYKNIDILNNISQEMFKLIKESLKYKELNIDLNSLLPNNNIDDFNNIVILYEVRNLLEQIRKVFNTIKNKRIKDDRLEPYKNIINKYMNQINEIYTSYIPLEDIKIEADENKNEKHIIYLTNNSNEILLKNDIKKDFSFYQNFISMLEDLKNGIITHNFTKDAKYMNNNLLSGICKKKDSEARLIYYPYDDYYIVFLGFIKKSNNNKYEITLLSERYSYYKNDIESVISILNDNELKDSFIEENDILHEELLNYLKTNSRTKKKDLHV